MNSSALVLLRKGDGKIMILPCHLSLNIPDSLLQMDVANLEQADRYRISMLAQLLIR